MKQPTEDKSTRFAKNRYPDIQRQLAFQAGWFAAKEDGAEFSAWQGDEINILRKKLARLDYFALAEEREQWRNLLQRANQFISRACVKHGDLLNDAYAITADIGRRLV